MPRLKTMLCPIDFSQNSIEILDFVVDMAVRTKLRLALLHVPKKMSINEIHGKFEDIEAQYFKGKSLTYEFAVGKGDFHDEILRFNKIFKTEFVTIGMSNPKKDESNVINATANWLIKSGSCVVLAIPPNWHAMSIANIALTAQPETRPRHWYVLLHLLRTLRSNVTVFHLGGKQYSDELISTHCQELLNRTPKDIIQLSEKSLLPGLENTINEAYNNIDMLVTMQEEGHSQRKEMKIQSLFSINKLILSIPYD